MGATGVALKAANDTGKSSSKLVKHINARKKIKKKLSEARDAIEALNAQLADLVEQRESLDVIIAKTREINAKIAATNAELEKGALAILAPALFGALAYRMTR